LALGVAIGLKATLLYTTAHIVVAGFLVQVDGFQAGHGHQGHQGHQIAFIAHQGFTVFVFVAHLHASLDKGHGLQLMHPALFSGDREDGQRLHKALRLGSLPLVGGTSAQAQEKN
jgi:hypothetical protein